jgi:hypothetical protein
VQTDAVQAGSDTPRAPAPLPCPDAAHYVASPRKGCRRAPCARRRSDDDHTRTWVNVVAVGMLENDE